MGTRRGRVFRKIVRFSASVVPLSVVLTFVTALPSQAVHDDGVFELDTVTASQAESLGICAIKQGNNITYQACGNANTGDESKAGEDWANVFGGTDSAIASTFINDGFRTGDTTRMEQDFFTGGGSKDTNGIQDGPWLYDTTNDVVPDSDDIVTAFAAAYEDPDSGHIVFYFGADRFDWDGDKQIGFWFFRNRVGLAPLEPDDNPDDTGYFTGEHADGDILVLADFRQGGRAGEVTVYKWSGDDATGGLQLLADKEEADCAVAPIGGDDLGTPPVGDAFCAVVNNSTGENPPWNYLNKDGTGAYGGAGALFEGGIDLTLLFGTSELGCFSTFLAETRSSHSTTAQLKDFAMGEFPLCDIEIDKTGDELSKVGDPANYTITITNTGSVTLYRQSIDDTLLGDLTDAGNAFVTGNTCGASLAGGASCTITATRTVEEGDPDPLPNTVTAVYTEHADGTGASFTISDDHEVNLFQPSVDVEKECTELSKATDDIECTITIDNTSSDDSPDLVLSSISDDLTGDLSAEATGAGCDVLASGDGCSFSYTYTVQESDPDPLENTVEVHYNPDGFPNDITDSDTFEIELFQPSVEVTKECNELSKVGDEITCEITITNTSSSDAPDLVLDSVSDTLVGDLTATAAANGCDVLASDGSCSFSYTYTVQESDPDPLLNTVEVHFHPDGFPNDITASDEFEIELFQPSVEVTKECDDLSKATDDIECTITITNSSSQDAPDLVLDSVEDSLKGDLTATAAGEGCDTLAFEGSCSFSYKYTVQESDPDPLENTVVVHYHPEGFPNDITDSDTEEIELFQPSVDVEKECNELSKVGDEITCEITITNTSSSDAPDLVLDSVEDTLEGDLTLLAGLAGCLQLASGDDCSFSYDYTVQAGDPDPLENTVEVHFHPEGFPNDITDTDTFEIELFQPGVDVAKACDELSKVGDDIECTITITNTSSEDAPDLVLDSVSDTLMGDLTATAAGEGCDTLAFEGSCSFSYKYTVQESDPDPLVNVVVVHYHPEGFPNDITDSAREEVNLFQPSVKVEKDCTDLSKVGDDIECTITITNTSSEDAPDLVLDSIDDTLMGDLSTLATNEGCDVIASGDSCSFGYKYTVQSGDPDPLENTVEVHYNPDGFPNDITDSDTEEIELFQPSVDVTKDCTDLSKIGDEVTCSIQITNDGSADSPDLEIAEVNDTIRNNGTVLDDLGDLMDNGPIVTSNTCDDGPLAVGDTCDITITFTVGANYTDPFVNRVDVLAHPVGFPNDITGRATDSVNLFQPSVDVEKECDDYTKAGDTLHCEVTITNTSSEDTPDLIVDSITDELRETGTSNVVVDLGDLLDPDNTYVTGNDCGNVLEGGESCTITTEVVVPQLDPTPDLTNVVVVHYHPRYFPNDITDTDSESIDTLHPSYTIEKSCFTEKVPIGGTAIFRVVVVNTGDIALNFDLEEAGGALQNSSPGANGYIQAVFGATEGDPVPAEVTLSIVGGHARFTLNAGHTVTFEISMKATTTNPVVNQITSVATLPTFTGLDNRLEDSAEAQCEVEAGATRTPGFWKTHVFYTRHIFNQHLGGTMDLGWRVVNNADELFGLFWASQSKNSDGSQRTPLCAACIKGAQMLATAILNTGLDNGATPPIDPVTGKDLITAMRDELASPTKTRAEILRLAGLLDDFNNSGDDVAIIDSHGVTAGKANPKQAKNIGQPYIALWDCEAAKKKK